MSSLAWTILEPGEDPGPHLRDAIVQLFEDEYFQYHYLDSLTNTSRLRCLVTHGHDVVGFAAATVSSTHAFLGNLLVRASVRGTGLGRKLEEARYAWVREHDLTAVVSCTCEDLASQRLKYQLGMRAIAIKYGYRRKVVSPDRWGSSVVFTDACHARTEPTCQVLPSSVRADSARHRVRIVGPADYVLDQLHAAPSGSYVDLLVSREYDETLARESGLARSGIDWDSETERWLHCFQLKNDVYEIGRAQGPHILMVPNGVPA